MYVNFELVSHGSATMKITERLCEYGRACVTPVHPRSLHAGTNGCSSRSTQTSSACQKTWQMLFWLLKCIFPKVCQCLESSCSVVLVVDTGSIMLVGIEADFRKQFQFTAVFKIYMSLRMFAPLHTQISTKIGNDCW